MLQYPSQTLALEMVQIRVSALHSVVVSHDAEEQFSDLCVVGHHQAADTIDTFDIRGLF